MLFDGLATDALLLVMQHCDAQSLLALARCSRHTHAAASSPFAWRELAPGPLSLPFVFRASPPVSQGSAWQRLARWIRPAPAPLQPQPQASQPQLLLGSLVRHCDILLQWRFDSGTYFTPSVSAAELDTLAAIPRLRALDARPRWSAGPAHVESLARRAGSLSGLTALSCAMQQLNQSAAEALAQNCPLLSTLTLGGARRLASAVPPVHLLSALTDLTIADNVDREDTMASISLCEGLRRLTFTTTVWARAVHAALVSPSLRSLQHLALFGIDLHHADGWSRPAAQVDWGAAFINLSSLRSLSLTRSHDVDGLLAVVGAHCEQLRSLRVRVPWLPAPVLHTLGPTVPSASALELLLDWLPPSCDLVLSLPPAEHCAALDQADLRAVHWRRAHAELSGFAALYPHRVTLLLE